MDPSKDDFQQWGVTADGFLVNRGAGSVLQLSAASPSPGLALNLGAQMPLGGGDAYQRFDTNAIDGAFHSRANPDYVIAKSGVTAVVQPYSAIDYTQLMEFISPFQFFGLKNQVSSGRGDNPWLSRQGNSVVDGSVVVNNQVVRPPGPEALFTVSRYGELISPLDGFVMQSMGANAAPQFIDPEPAPIGFDSTTFFYKLDGTGGYGTIRLRTGNLALTVTYRGAPSQMMMSPPGTIGNGFGASFCWQLVGEPGSVFSDYQSLAQAFFTSPAPLPGQIVVLADFDSGTTLSKTQQVIIVLVVGLLDIVAGISVGTVGDAVAARVAQVVLGNSEVAARVAVVMQGTVTAASIIAVADGITKAGLWTKLFVMLMPNSFWGWVLMIAKIGVLIASYAEGFGFALTGARIGLLVATILQIVVSDSAAAATEAAVLMAHAERLRQQEGLSPSAVSQTGAVMDTLAS